MSNTNLYDNFPEDILLGVKVVIVNKKGEFLLLKRSNAGSRPGGWDFCGGAVEAGENPEQAAAREVEEESGLKVVNLSLIDKYSFAKDLIYGKVRHTMIIGYQGFAETDNVQLSDEHAEYKWLSKSAAEKLRLPKMHKRFLSLFR
jgi:8-oxo-dGTP diphosphatase